MFLIPKIVYEKLKCINCKEVITSSPIYLNKDAENVCGTCKITKKEHKNLIRNYLFEEMAEHLLIPCKYEERGCKDQLKWGKVGEHQNNCKFGKKDIMNCPSLPTGKCPWKGSLDELVAHYVNKHKEFLVFHPYQLTSHSNWIMDTIKLLPVHKRKSSCKHFLMEAHGYLFLLRIKVCIQSDTFWIFVFFLGNPKLAVHFQAFIEFNKEVVETNFINVSEVIPYSTIFDENSASKFKLQTHFEISINVNAIKCINCNKIFEKVHFNDNHYCCENYQFVSCGEPRSDNVLMRCVNLKKGCSFIGNRESIAKHSLFLCTHDKTHCCPTCGKNVFEHGKNLFQHMKTHEDYSEIFKDNVSIDRNEEILTITNGVWEVTNGSFLIKWGTAVPLIQLLGIFPIGQNVSFFCNVMSDFPTEIEEKLVIKLTFINKFTGKQVSKIMERKISNDKRMFNDPILDVLHEWVIDFPIDIVSNLVSYKVDVCLLDTSV